MVRNKTHLLVNLPQPPSLGDAVEILWQDENCYYRGVLTRQNHLLPYNFLIFYDDGDSEILDLDEEYWRYSRPTRRTKGRAHFSPGDVALVWLHGRPLMSWGNPTLVAARLSSRKSRGTATEESEAESEELQGDDPDLDDDDFKKDSNRAAVRVSLLVKERFKRAADEDTLDSKLAEKMKYQLTNNVILIGCEKHMRTRSMGGNVGKACSSPEIPKRKTNIDEPSRKAQKEILNFSKTPSQMTRSSVRKQISKQRLARPRVGKQELTMLRVLANVAASQERRVSFRAEKAS